MDGATFETANPTTYTVEDAITLNNPGKDGYEFAGWYDNEGFTGSAITGVAIAKGSTGDKTFWAKWTRPITSEGITISIPSQEWTGSALTPVITVTDGTTTLNEGTDYTVTAPSGPIQDAGDYTFTITGKGNYSGETTVTFTIVPKTVTVKNDQNEDLPAATGDAEITEDQTGLTLTLITPEEDETPQTVSIPTPVEVDHVDVERSYTSGKAATVYLPFSIDVSKVSGGKFYKFTDVVETKTPWEVTYDEITTGEIKANTPYIFLPDGANDGKIVVNNGADKITVGTGIACEQQKDLDGKWEFIGTYEQIRWLSDPDAEGYTAARAAEIGRVYGFAAENLTVGEKNFTVGQFVKVGSGAHINPMRAYLIRSTDNSGVRAAARGAGEELPSTMKVIIRGAKGDTTEIGTFTIDSETGDWYSLDGRKLSGKPSAKGLYIHNGRKEVIR